jgi:hypothetical protein
VAAAPAPEEELAEEQAPAARSLAPDLLRRRVPLRGRRVTGDARACPQARWAQIRQAHGPSLFVITAHQPARAAEVGLRLEQPPPGEPGTTARRGRPQRARHEVRPLTASAAVADSLRAVGWAGAQPVLRLERCVTPLRGVHAGQTRHLVRYFLTRLGAQVPARQLLRLIREQWPIENRLHDGRDVPLGEAASPVRSGAAPPARAA